ncbi:MAG: hypothetical protein JNL18_00170 [Planctomycetaceae bacterium]|nr:hypothetical protein [Planctomycetaceae bacterium]
MSVVSGPLSVAIEMQAFWQLATDNGPLTNSIVIAVQVNRNVGLAASGVVGSARACDD